MHYDMVLRLFNHCAWMIQFSSILQFLLSLRRLRSLSVYLAKQLFVLCRDGIFVRDSQRLMAKT